MYLSQHPFSRYYRCTNLREGTHRAFPHYGASYRRRYNARTWCGCVAWSYKVCNLLVTSAYILSTYWQNKPVANEYWMKKKNDHRDRAYEFNSLVLYILSMTSLACISITTMALSFNRSSLLRSPRIASEYLSNAWFCRFFSFRSGFFESAILKCVSKSNKTNWKYEMNNVTIYAAARSLI